MGLFGHLPGLGPVLSTTPVSVSSSRVSSAQCPEKGSRIRGTSWAALIQNRSVQGPGAEGPC